MAQIALQYGNSVAVVDDSALNIIMPSDVFPNYDGPATTMAQAIADGTIQEATSPEAVSQAQEVVTTQRASAIVQGIQGGLKITDNPNNQGMLNNMVQTLVRAGIDQSDAETIVQMGVSPAEQSTGQTGTQLGQPLNTGSTGSNPLNTGSQALTNFVNQIPQAPVQFIPRQPGQADYMNWLILLVLAFIAIWIAMEVFR